MKTIENYQILPVKTVLKEAKFLRENEIEKIKNYVEKNLKYKAIIQLFLTTGVRLAEICTITNEQIEKAINLGEVYQINIIGKGSKLRSIFPPVETIELCKNLKNKGETVIGWQKRRVSNLMRRISKATKISFTAHTLRHTYLSNLARK
ncbi:MAG: site-specific integrase [Candidatus Peribacteria bacterium]|nr:site-specific integrase [Candidatus Peribacteria bacterium]